MNEINGVHASNLGLHKTDDSVKQNNEENESLLFDEIEAEDANIDSLKENLGKQFSEEEIQLLKEKFGEAVISGALLGGIKGANISELLSKLTDKGKLSDEEIEEIMNSAKTSAEDMQNFDIEEAHVYAEGEADIAKMVEEEKKKHMLLHGGIGGAVGTIVGTATFDEEAVEKECRAKYAEEHPEYKAVMNEGLAVEKQYDNAKEKEMSNWEEKNPKPQRNKLATFLGGIIPEAIYQHELKKWEEAKAEHEKTFEEDYAKNNPNYANLKEQQEAQEEKAKPKLHLAANAGGAAGGFVAGAATTAAVGGPIAILPGGIIGGILGAFGSEKVADYKDSKEI